MQDNLSEVALILIGSTLIILMFISLIITSLFVNQKRKFRHSNEMIHLKNTYDQELLKTQLEIQSQTFQSISRELHDNVGTIISIALVHTKSLPEISNQQEQQKITAVTSLLNEAMDTLRDISKSLNPENIRQSGWLKSFYAELERIRKTNLFTIDASTGGEPFNIDESKQIILFRILQEALNNIVKHSEASAIKLLILFSAAELKITMSDNGKGFIDQPSVAGSGIKNMKARAAMLPANLEIESRPGVGTAINIFYINPGNDTGKT